MPGFNYGQVERNLASEGRRVQERRQTPLRPREGSVDERIVSQPRRDYGDIQPTQEQEFETVEEAATVLLGAVNYDSVRLQHFGEGTSSRTPVLTVENLKKRYPEHAVVKLTNRDIHMIWKLAK